ncbi:putative glycosyltransferase EpsH [Lachnospiraceae bacterium]|nr:putative glycosyltransferase EpsH [Lachnospiraceae bacterium]
MLFTISIIIPLYKGGKYIPSLIKMAKENKKMARKYFEISLELVFVNDFPEERIIYNFLQEKESEIDIKLIENKDNLGIHRSRVNGMNCAKGEYIIFLDQDDYIKKEYLCEQIKYICGKDAVLCNGIKEYFCQSRKRMIFMSYQAQIESVKMDTLINKGNYIISPGQMMIKKSCIPSIWTNNWILSNGADDLFLWILMAQNEISYGFCTSLLYVHRSHGDNVSNDYVTMTNSLLEMVKYLSDNKVLNEKYKLALNNRIYNEKKEIRINELNDIYDKWLYLKINGINLASYFEKKKFFNIAIYGMGQLGCRFYEDISSQNIRVLYAIDKNADAIFICGIKIITLECELIKEYLAQVDVVVVTVTDGFLVNEIEREIKQLKDIPVVSLNEVITSLL